MKKLFYFLCVAIFIAGSVNATNSNGKLKVEKVKIFKVEKMETITTKIVDGKTVFLRYRGRCKDGTTFTFSANSSEEAQAYVNGFCAAVRQFSPN